MIFKDEHLLDQSLKKTKIFTKPSIKNTHHHVEKEKNKCMYVCLFVILIFYVSNFSFNMISLFVFSFYFSHYSDVTLM